jgi:DNA-directed RNA polymerase subunit M/transcription elongation factor TFIIS
MKEKYNKEEKEKEVQERIVMRGEIRRLKEILRERLGKESCIVEIFKFSWNTLTWIMIKRSSVRTYLKLLEIVLDNTSTAEDRYRIELTPLHQLNPGEKEKKADNIEYGIKERVRVEDVKGEEKGGDIEREEKVEHVQEIKEEEIECLRCGGKNIKTWSAAYVIKTRSGDKRLRHRCTDCNETFSDEDLGISG